MVRQSNRWNYSNKKALVCKECVESIFTESANMYGEKIALAACCAMLDYPYHIETYESIIDKSTIFTMGVYVRMMNMAQFSRRTFINSIIDGELDKSEQEVRESIESKWSKQDKQNMNYSLSVVGYDPFEECGMTNNDRKYCFNILSGYCDDDSVKRDNHKIQCVIQITHMHLQIQRLDESINRELSNVTPEETKIKKLTEVKKSLLDSISKMSKDNNLASNYNDNSRKGKDTLSDKIKEMSENDFEKIKVNVFDIKTAAAMKQIADLSNKSILDQLSYDANDYTDIIKEQRELIIKFESERDALAEENRKLKNYIQELNTKKR